MAAVLGFLNHQAGPPSAYLHAQTEVAEFYGRLGFMQRGEVFIEAGIPHVAMRLDDIEPPA